MTCRLQCAICSKSVTTCRMARSWPVRIDSWLYVFIISIPIWQWMCLIAVLIYHPTKPCRHGGHPQARGQRLGIMQTPDATTHATHFKHFWKGTPGPIDARMRGALSQLALIISCDSTHHRSGTLHVLGPHPDPMWATATAIAYDGSDITNCTDTHWEHPWRHCTTLVTLLLRLAQLPKLSFKKMRDTLGVWESSVACPTVAQWKVMILWFVPRVLKCCKTLMTIQ